jgi:hypothetical protein
MRSKEIRRIISYKRRFLYSFEIMSSIFDFWHCLSTRQEQRTPSKLIRGDICTNTRLLRHLRYGGGFRAPRSFVSFRPQNFGIGQSKGMALDEIDAISSRFL